MEAFEIEVMKTDKIKRKKEQTLGVMINGEVYGVELKLTMVGRRRVASRR